MLPDGLGKQGDGGCAIAGIIDIGAYSGGEVSFVLGCTGSVQAAEECAARMAHADTAAVLRNAEARWKELSGRFTVHTGDEKLDWLVNGFLLKQVLDGRIRARAGFYQAGGAYGFRDQLQDMLALLPYSPETVRSHLLECARHQFRDGDVMHWWHPPMTGVRTHISDDMLFLPFVTYHYVRHTGDRDVLDCALPYLENIAIPDGREDIYSEMKHSSETGTLEEHCMRAFRRACRRGAHGLLLMGAGDWNDGMNRIGYRGRGESVWLTMFFAVCARLFAGIIGEGMDRAWLLSQADELTENIRKQGWDGKWYLRAYDDNGEKLGSSGNAECSIDLIAQAWSAFADCEPERVDAALDSAWRRLFVPEHSLMKLLTPPFSGEGYDPGYIGAYPPGVRENGGQYTHAACWMLIALAKNGDADRAGRLLEALMPLNHAATTEEADKYRVEPYVVAADIYGEEPYAGRGGWTWYTGAAGWLMCGVRYLLGYERRGDKVRLNALRGMWTRPRVCVRFGSSEYTLISDDAAGYVMLDGRAAEGEWIRMEDDGKKHECVFPSRNK